MAVYLHPHSGKDLVAQLVEHLPFKERVLGSSPSQVTKKMRKPSLKNEGFFMSFNEKELSDLIKGTVSFSA